MFLKKKIHIIILFLVSILVNFCIYVLLILGKIFFFFLPYVETYVITFGIILLFLYNLVCQFYFKTLFFSFLVFHI